MILSNPDPFSNPFETDKNWFCYTGRLQMLNFSLPLWDFTLYLLYFDKVMSQNIILTIDLCYVRVYQFTSKRIG